jgi:hypothetical protein
MPGVFAVRSQEERRQFQEDWLALTLERDVLSFPNLSIQSDVCREILKQVATLEEPNEANLRKATRTSSKIFQKHIHALLNLFVLHRLDPHPLGTGKPIYFLCDVALANTLGASFERSLYTWLIQEQLSQRSYRQDIDHELFFYRNTKGSLIHLIVQSRLALGNPIAAIKLFSEERLDLRELEILWALKKKIDPNQKIELLGLGPSPFLVPSKEPLCGKEKIEIHPWESIC